MESETICHYCGEKLPHEKCTEVKKPELGEFTKKIEQKYNGTNHWADWVIEIDLKKACKEIDRLAMQRDYKDKAIKRLRKKQKNQAKAINFLVAELNAKDEKITKLIDALTRIDIRAKAYPLDNYPKPDLKKAAKVLKEAGMTLDAISADAIRHVLGGIKNIVTEALKENNG